MSGTDGAADAASQDRSELGEVQKVRTGIPGFDLVTFGGLPRGRTTLVAGTSGSAKTVFAAQFLAEGIRQLGAPGVFVTLEENPRDIRRNMASMGWDIAAWEEQGLWAFVDASPHVDDGPTVTGGYDLGALLARVQHAVRRIGAQRASIDSIGAVYHQLPEPGALRGELFRVVSTLRDMDVTTVLTAERVAEYGEIARFGVEEFVADNVVILRNVLEEEKRRRTVEVLKLRGTSHQKGEYPFTVQDGKGIVVLPLSAIELKQRSSLARISSGNAELDAICGGGFFRDSIILVSGATGTGKTLMTTEFLAGGAAAGETCLLFAFEESREQLFRNAIGWGHDFERLEREGRLVVECYYPEAGSLEDHLLRMQATVREIRPQRLAVDSLSALERVASTRSFREFVIGLTSSIKQQEIAGLFTATSPMLMGGSSVTETHISTITDSIILLRYVELLGEMRRGLTVLKMRGSGHDKQIREFAIDSTGLHIGLAFTNVSGILTGYARQTSVSDLDRVRALFQEDSL